MTDIEQVMMTGICVGRGGCARLYPQDFKNKGHAMGRFAVCRMSADGSDAAAAFGPISGVGADADAVAAALCPDPQIGHRGYAGLGWVAAARVAGDLWVFRARTAPILAAAYRRATLPPLQRRLKNRLSHSLNRTVPGGARKKRTSPAVAKAPGAPAPFRSLR